MCHVGCALSLFDDRPFFDSRLDQSDKTLAWLKAHLLNKCEDTTAMALGIVHLDMILF